MADTPTDQYGFRQQSLGSNTNTWGDDKLNQVIRGIAQSIGSVKSIALTGDYTITSTNYVTAADNKNGGHLFTGSLSSAVVVTYPSSKAKYLIHNTCGASLTAKCSGATGVVIPNNMMAWVYCNGTDILSYGSLINGASQVNGKLTISGVLAGVSAGVLGTDGVNLTQVEALIAAGGIPGAPGTVKVDASATANYLGVVLTASGAVSLTDNGNTLNISAPADSNKVGVDAAAVPNYLGTVLTASGAVSLTDNGNTLNISAAAADTNWEEALAGKLTGTISSGTTAMTANRRYRISAAATGTLPSFSAGQGLIVEFTVGDTVVATVGRNSQTIDGAAANDTYTGDGSTGPIILYSFVSSGVVTSTLIGATP